LAAEALVRFTRVFGESPTRWIAYGIAIGIASGLGAVAFAVLLELATHLTFGMLAGLPVVHPPGDQLLQLPGEIAAEPRRWLFFLLPTLGGLASGVLVFAFAPEAAGPGTDQMIRAFHRERGKVRGRVPIVKGLATLCTLAGGGSASIMSQRGSVVVDSRTNTLIIKELPNFIDAVIAIIEQLDQVG